MKKYILFVLIGLMSLPYFSAFGQKDFEGKVVYSIEYLSIPEEMRGMEGMLPNELTVTIEGDRSRLEQTGGQGETQVILNDQNARKSAILMNFMGRKIALQATDADYDVWVGASEETTIRYDKEKKVVAGVKCKKAVITSPDSQSPTVVFYNPKMSNYANTLSGLKGFPLEYTVFSGGFQIRYTATAVDPQEIEESLFDIPTDYELMTQEEFEESMQGLE